MDDSTVFAGLVLHGHRRPIRHTTENGTITITGYAGPDGPVTIPETIDGLPVVTLGDGAFAERVGVTQVTFPDCVVQIRGGGVQHLLGFNQCDTGGFTG